MHRVKEARNILHAIKIRKTNWFGYILRRKRLLKHIIKGKIKGRIEVMGRRRRRRKWILDYLKETRRYRKLKRDDIALCRELVLDEAVDLSKDTAERMNGWMNTPT